MAHPATQPAAAKSIWEILCCVSIPPGDERAKFAIRNMGSTIFAGRGNRRKRARQVPDCCWCKKSCTCWLIYIVYYFLILKTVKSTLQPYIGYGRFFISTASPNYHQTIHDSHRTTLGSPETHSPYRAPVRRRHHHSSGWCYDVYLLVLLLHQDGSPHLRHYHVPQISKCWQLIFIDWLDNVNSGLINPLLPPPISRRSRRF